MCWTLFLLTLLGLARVWTPQLPRPEVRGGHKAPEHPGPRDHSRQEGAVAGPENKEDLGHFDFIQGL